MSATARAVDPARRRDGVEGGIPARQEADIDVDLDADEAALILTPEERSVNYVTDRDGVRTAAIVPIDFWREIESERETFYLIKDEAMRERLLSAMRSTETIPLDEVLRRTGLDKNPEVLRALGREPAGGE